MKQVIRGQKRLAAAGLAVALFTVSAWAGATTTHYVTNFTTLNNSGVTGGAMLTLNNDMLTVHITASGLQTDVQHVQHIHGPFDSNGNPSQAMTPTLANDTNNDGVIELGEGGLTYGPILVPLTPFPTTADGTIDFTQTYNLTDSSIFSTGYTEADLFPLDFREIVLHGLNAPIALTDGGVDYMKGEYDPVLPVASGVLRAAVPEPGQWGTMTCGLGLLAGLLWLKRRRVAV